MLHVKLLDDWRCNDDEGTFLNCGGVEGCIIVEITKKGVKINMGVAPENIE